MQHVRSTARGAALRGNGWRDSQAFSIPGMERMSNPKAIREARLKAAIRRLAFAREAK